MIQAVELAMTYYPQSGEVVVFQGLNLLVRGGESLAVVGESGSGKSTLLHLLGGLDKPTGGKVLVDGMDLTQLDPNELAEVRNRKVGFVWQRPSLLPEFSVLENVMMPLRIRGVSAVDASLRAREQLEEVGLTDRARHRAGELSGGEQQRVALARSLVGRPAILLADEPTGNLDGDTARRVSELIFRSLRAHNLAVVIVTHSQELAQMCDSRQTLERRIQNS